MTYRVVPARQGLHWLRQGLASFVDQPIAFGGLFMTAFMAMMLLSMLPIVGLPLSLILTPCVAFGLMAAVGELRARRIVTPALLIEGLRGEPLRRRNMLRLGLLYGALFLAWAVLWLSGIDWKQLVAPGEQAPSMQALQDNPFVVRAVFMVGAGNVPLVMVSMHAAALVYWNRSTVLSAVGQSLAAMARNLPAFALLLVVLLLGFMTVGTLLQWVTALSGSALLVLAVMFATWSAVCCVGLGAMFQAFIDCHPRQDAAGS